MLSLFIMATHIMAIVTFNRTMSIHTLIIAIILVLTSLGIPLLANVSSFENSKNHLNFDHYNVGDNELYDEGALIGDGELYKDHEEIRIPEFYPEKTVISPLNSLLTEAVAPSQLPLGAVAPSQSPLDKPERNEFSTVLANLEWISESGNQMTVSQFSHLLLTFLNGSNSDCHKNSNVGSFPNISKESNKNNVINLSHQHQPRRENRFLASEVLQLNNGQETENQNSKKPSITSQMAKDVLRTNNLLKKELYDLKHMNRNDNLLHRKKREEQIQPQDNLNVQSFQDELAYPCNKNIDSDTAQILKKLASAMSLKQGETLAKLFAMFMKNVDISLSPQHVHNPPTDVSTLKTSKVMYPTSGFPEDSKQRMNSRKMHERQIQALNNIISRRRKRSIVDFDKDLRRGSYAHNVERFPYSMRIKQKKGIKSEFNDKDDGSNKDVHDDDADTINAKRPNRENKSEDEENPGSKLESAKSEVASSNIRTDRFPSLEKTKQEKMFVSGRINVKQNHASEKKRKNIKKQMKKGIKEVNRNETPSSSRVTYTNKADKTPRTKTGSKKVPKSTPHKEILVSFLESNEGKERQKRSIHHDLDSNQLEHKVYRSNFENKMSEKFSPVEVINIRDKRSIVDFNNMKSEGMHHASNEVGIGEMAKINRFPYSERTRGKKYKTKASVFGFNVNERRPITDFEDLTAKGKTKHNKNEILKVNKLPRTERLMAPKIARQIKVVTFDRLRQLKKKERSNRKHRRANSKRLADLNDRKVYHKK